MVSKIVWLCDGDHPGGPAPAGTPRRFMIPGLGSRECEMCDECFARLVNPLVELLSAVGREDVGIARRGGSEANEARYKCLYKTCAIVGYASMQSINTHIIKQHGLLVRNVLPPSLARCPLCGERTNGVAALGLHIGKIHRSTEGDDVTAYSAVWLAGRRGDKYGVYAEVLQFLADNGASAHPGGRGNGS